MYIWDRDLHDLTLPLSELQSSISSTLYINYSMSFISAFFFNDFERALCYYYLVLIYLYIRLGG